MLDNCTYNKAKIAHHLSSLCWFIKNHALADAQKAGEAQLIDELNNLHKDLEKHITVMGECLCECK